MATIPVQQVNGPYVPSNDTTPLTAVGWTAASTGTDTFTIPRKRALLVARNVGASTRTVAVSSSYDAYGRKADIPATNLAAGALMARFFEPHGWEISLGGRNIELVGSHAEVQFAVFDIE